MTANHVIGIHMIACHHVLQLHTCPYTVVNLLACCPNTCVTVRLLLHVSLATYLILQELKLHQHHLSSGGMPTVGVGGSGHMTTSIYSLWLVGPGCGPGGVAITCEQQLCFLSAGASGSICSAAADAYFIAFSCGTQGRCHDARR